MARPRIRWNPPPGWPAPPHRDWLPPPGWQPARHWPAAPAGWQFYRIEPATAPPPASAPGLPPSPARPAPAIAAPVSLPPVAAAAGRRRTGTRTLLVVTALVIAVLTVAALTLPRAATPPAAAPTTTPTVVAAAPQALEQPAAPPLPTATIVAPPPITAELPADVAPSESPQRWPGFPPPGLNERPTRLLPAVTPPGRGDYAFMQTQPNGAPVGYSPCRPWPVVVNLNSAPPGAYGIVAQSVDAISKATGLALYLEGTTDEQYSADREAYQPQRYGDRWAPILVAWAPEMREAVAGHGGSRSVTLPTTGISHYVTGFVAIDSTDQANTSASDLEAVLLHELAHVVGLEHSADPNQLMAPIYRGQDGLGVGDLAGLAAVGRAACAPDL